MNSDSNNSQAPDSNILSHLGDISVSDFLANYWQKKPLLIRQAFPNLEDPISPDELAGLAMEGDIESRLIIENNGADSQGKGPWQLKNGPFTESDFQSLPESHWTLLVQAVDQWVPEVRCLLDSFRFLPSWRLDDIMISYAPRGGSVGPHYDQYDVFLIQGSGQRQWSTGQMCHTDSPRLENTALNILEDFQEQQTWTLNPGDMLYLPPQLAHWGIANEESLTYSVGFRAPSHGELIGHFADQILDHGSESQRYSDAGFAQQQHSAEISPQAIEQLQSIIKQQLDDPEKLAQWLGELMTQRKYPDTDSFEEVEDWLDVLQGGALLVPHPATRFAFHGDKLFVDGASFSCSTDFAQFIAQGHSLSFQELEDFLQQDELREIINTLIQHQRYFIDDES